MGESVFSVFKESNEGSEREKWLKSLKVGDEVAIDVGSYGYSSWEIHKVQKITPKRMFDVNGSRFRSDGYSVGKSSSWSPRRHMEPVTDEIREKIKRKNALTAVNGLKADKLSTNQLLAILEITKQDTLTDEVLMKIQLVLQDA